MHVLEHSTGKEVIEINESIKSSELQKRSCKLEGVFGLMQEGVNSFIWFHTPCVSGRQKSKTCTNWGDGNAFAEKSL